LCCSASTSADVPIEIIRKALAGTPLRATPIVGCHLDVGASARRTAANRGVASSSTARARKDLYSLSISLSSIYLFLSFFFSLFFFAFYFLLFTLPRPAQKFRSTWSTSSHDSGALQQLVLHAPEQLPSSFVTSPCLLQTRDGSCQQFTGGWQQTSTVQLTEEVQGTPRSRYSPRWLHSVSRFAS